MEVKIKETKTPAPQYPRLMKSMFGPVGIFFKITDTKYTAIQFDDSGVKLFSSCILPDLAVWQDFHGEVIIRND